MSVYGEFLPRTSFNVLYHLENLNDSSGNGRTLTNENTVTFVAARFANGAVFGSTTNKQLSLAANFFSALTVPNLTISLWFKLNSTSNSPTALEFLIDSMSRLTAGSGACRSTIYYAIASGTITLTVQTNLVTTNSVASVAFTANTTTWYNVILVKSATTLTTGYLNGAPFGSSTGSGADASTSGTRYLMIGNRNALNTSHAIIDEVAIEERAWSANEVRRYYAQTKGLMAPK